MTLDIVQKKQICPKVQAGFLHAITVDDMQKTKDAVAKLKETDCIFYDLKEPCGVVKGMAYHYVNFEKPMEELRDKAFDVDGDFHADRMGPRPRILVRFNEERIIKFKLELVPPKKTENLEYYEDEIKRNDRFKQQLKFKNGEEWQTNARGYYIINDGDEKELFLSAAGGNRYYIRITVNDPLYDEDPIDFKANTIQTARYLWMLPVVGGGGRWIPKYSPEKCLEKTLALYRKYFIHIKSLPMQIANDKDNDLEWLEHDHIKTVDRFEKYLKPIFNNLLSGLGCPNSMKKYIFVMLMARFACKIFNDYTRKELIFSGNQSETIPCRNNPVAPFKGRKDKSYLRSVEVRLINEPKKPKLYGFDGYVRAVDGYDNENARDPNGGRICCKRFELDMWGIRKELEKQLKKTIIAGMAFEMTIRFHMMGPKSFGGATWRDGRRPSGFCFFSTQKRDEKEILLNLEQEEISIVASHELGHMVQMVPDGKGIEPKKTDNYYHDKDDTLPQELKDDKGAHCRTGFDAVNPGAICLMFGHSHPSIEHAFCDASKNSCATAIKKVDLSKPFIGHRQEKWLLSWLLEN